MIVYIHIYIYIHIPGLSRRVLHFGFREVRVLLCHSKISELQF